MDDEEDYSSDSSDEDYRPSDGEAVSEEDESGEEENFEDGDKTDSSAISKKKGKSKKKRTKEAEPLIRKRQGGIRLEDEEDPEPEVEDTYNKELEQQIEQEKEEKKQEEEKKKSDNLWASFLSDVGPRPKPKPAVTGSGLGLLSSKTNSSSSASSILSTKPSASSSTESASVSNGGTKPGKVTITKEYDFAGETVKITKEVEASSKEAKEELKKQEEGQEKKSSASPVIPGLKRPAAGGGLGSVLGKIGKKPKISTLDKSKLDWNSFKRQEGIEEELAIHNRGKEGYIERQAFLNRTDQRQFEQERAMRLGTKK